MKHAVVENNRMEIMQVRCMCGQQLHVYGHDSHRTSEEGQPETWEIDQRTFPHVCKEDNLEYFQACTESNLLEDAAGFTPDDYDRMDQAVQEAESD